MKPVTTGLPHIDAAKHLRLTVSRYLLDRAMFREVEEAMSMLRDVAPGDDAERARAAIREITAFSTSSRRINVQPYTLQRWVKALHGVAVLALVVLIGCSVHDPHVHLLDARPADGPPDACVNQLDAPEGDCCALLPDQDAVRACGAPPPGACGDIVCHLPDCSLLVLQACGPMIDGSVDTPGAS